MTSAEQEYYRGLIERLRELPTETEWVEFKVNNADRAIYFCLVQFCSLLQPGESLSFVGNRR